jgi:hypothetical protein
MAKMLHNKNRSVDELIELVCREEQVIVRRLRAIIRECLPHAIEKNTYGAPFYSRHRMICFLWQPSLYWGSKNRTLEERGVTLGFCQGNRMMNERKLLLREGRKQMYCIYYRSLDEIDEDQVRAWLYEADLVDQEFQKKRKKIR